MRTYIVFVDGVNYYGARSVRKEVKAPDILTACALATTNGGIVSMVWPKY